MGNQVLKRLAVRAKNRLINRDSAEGLNKDKKNVYSANVKFKIISNDDIEFNDRANSLGEEDLLNPFSKLMDNEYFLKLNPQSREKYLLDTIEKYAKFRKKLDGNKEKIRALS